MVELFRNFWRVYSATFDLSCRLSTRLRDYVLTHSLRKSPEGVGAAPLRKALMDRMFYNTPAPTLLKIRGVGTGCFCNVLTFNVFKTRAAPTRPGRPSCRRQFHVNRPHDFTRSTCVILSPRRGAPSRPRPTLPHPGPHDLPPLPNHNNDHTDDRENRLENPLQKHCPIIGTLRSDIHRIIYRTLTTYIYR